MYNESKPKQQEIFSIERSGYMIPEGHILKKISNTYNFDRWYNILENSFKSNKGRKPKDTLIKAKMLFLQFMFNLSDREIEQRLNENLMFRWFCGLPLIEASPDYSSLSKLRKRLEENKLSALFEDIVKVAREKGMITDKWNAVDATHLIANVSESRKIVSNKKHNISKEQDNPKAWRKNDPRPPSDPDARHGAKSKEKLFFGYKAHLAMDVDSSVFTRIHITSGEAHDGVNLIHVIDTNAKNLTADKIYDSSTNNYLLNELGIRNWIYKKEKKIAFWLRKVRAPIERKFGEAKKWHGLELCRYRTIKAVKNHCYWIFMVLNLKRMAALT